MLVCFNESNCLIERFSYTPTIGSILGHCCGLSMRLWEGLPADFKLSPKMVQPIAPWINSGMQAIIKGAGKYLLVLAPLIILFGKATFQSYQENSLQPLKNQFLTHLRQK